MTKRLIQLASLLAATSLTACSTSAQQSHPNPSLEVPAGWQTLALKGGNSPVVLVHPTAWREIKAEDASQGPAANIEYLTDQPTVAQCYTSHTRETVSYGCKPPVAQLTPGGVLVTLGGLFVDTGRGSVTNTVVDGHAADIRTTPQPTPDEAECPTGATGSEVMNVELQAVAPRNPKSHWRFYAYACFAAGAPNGANLAADIDKMLRSTTFPKVAQH